KDLLEQTPRRLAETLDFVTKTSTRGSLRPGADGWRTTVRVRLIHAQVRHALSNMPHWDAGAWGTPINQTEMVGTNLAFSSIFMDGTRKLGARYTPAEAQSIMDLWRYSGYLLGVDEPLLARSDTQGRRIAAAILATQAPPNEDSRRLIEALTRVSLTANPPAALGDVQRSMTHYLIGDYYANELNLTADVGRDAARATVPAAGRSADLLRGLPFGNRVSVRSGRLLWKSITKGLLGKNPSEFLIPEHGQGVRSAALP
ncbi:MAG: DUF2236 domain-containing protein, partial [Myxococcales bacterium]|nr:DUF2236 domain-containing protein [Myxococcales bacterium]